MKSLSNFVDVAVLTTRTRWSEVPRLRHQIARVLSRYLPVVFVETPIHWTTWHGTEMEEVEANIVRLRPSNRWNLPTRLKAHVRVADYMLQRKLAADIDLCLRRLGKGGGRALLMNFNHNATRLMQSDAFCASVYICNDDWVAKAPDRWTRRAVERTERAVAASADLCLGVSYPLQQRLMRYNPNVRLLLPAHDFELRSAPAAATQHGPELIKVSFMGELNGRLDYDWVTAAARAPGLEFHMIGPVEIPPSVVASLVSAGVHLHSPKFGAELREFLESMDVLVMPYLVKRGVLAATAPNKLFKYIAAGRPVVISDMPNFIDLGPQVIYRARTAGEFVQQIRAAAAEDDDRARSLRRAIAEEHSWERRGSELFKMLEEAVARRSGSSRDHDHQSETAEA